LSNRGIKINITERRPNRLYRTPRSARLYGRGLKIPLLLLFAQKVDDEGDAQPERYGQKYDQKAADHTPAPAAASAARGGVDGGRPGRDGG